MAETEFFRFEDDERLEIEVHYGYPVKQERILFHRDRNRSTPASAISEIFWQDPGVLHRLATVINNVGNIYPLNDAKASLIAEASEAIEQFIKATEVTPGED